MQHPNQESIEVGGKNNLSELPQILNQTLFKNCYKKYHFIIKIFMNILGETNSEIIAHYHICFVKKKKRKEKKGWIFITRELPVVVDEW